MHVSISSLGHPTRVDPSLHPHSGKSEGFSKVVLAFKLMSFKKEEEEKRKSVQSIRIWSFIIFFSDWHRLRKDTKKRKKEKMPISQMHIWLYA